MPQHTRGLTAMRIGTIETPLRLAVFISGSGSGMEALLHYQKTKPCLHETTLVLSNLAEVAGLEKATNFGVDTVVVEIDNSIQDPKVRRQSHEKQIMKTLEKHNIEAVILSGYMRIMSPLFVNAWKGRLLNIHPSLLPMYPGAHAHRDALADGAKVTGCTVHFVDDQYDHGPILLQRVVEVQQNDTPEKLAERVFVAECEAYPEESMSTMAFVTAQTNCAWKR